MHSGCRPEADAELLSWLLASVTWSTIGSSQLGNILLWEMPPQPVHDLLLHSFGEANFLEGCEQFDTLVVA